MNRYTYMENGHWRVKIGEQEIRAGFVDRLAAYESIGLTAEEIEDRLEMLKSYRHVCGGMPPEEIENLVRKKKCDEAENDRKVPDIFKELFDINARKRIGGY